MKNISENSMAIKEIKKFYVNNKNKDKKYKQNTTSPYNKKGKLSKKKIAINNLIELNTKDNNHNSKVLLNNEYNRFLTKKGMRTQSISIDLSSITHNNIYNHYSDKKIENIFQNNKNILTLRDEEFYDKYPSKYNQRNVDNNENLMEINYSYKTILTTSKKSRS